MKTSQFDAKPDEVDHWTLESHWCAGCWHWVVDCEHLLNPLPLEHHAVDDGWIQSLAYDRKTQCLEVRFKWSSVHQYRPVPLAESGAGDETIMAIAGHVSRSMLRRYAHIRTEAKRRALEAITTQAPPDSDIPPQKSSPLELTVN